MTESPIESAKIDTFIVKFRSLLVSQRLHEPSFLHIFWHWISLTSLISKLKGKICKNACSTLFCTTLSNHSLLCIHFQSLAYFLLDGARRNWIPISLSKQKRMKALVFYVKHLLQSCLLNLQSLKQTFTGNCTFVLIRIQEFPYFLPATS